MVILVRSTAEMFLGQVVRGGGVGGVSLAVQLRDGCAVHAEPLVVEEGVVEPGGVVGDAGDVGPQLVPVRWRGIDVQDDGDRFAGSPGYAWILPDVDVRVYPFVFNGVDRGV